ncbi:MAG: hypothetical protein ACREMO_12800, partial [Gemmatimonadales bacterium]
ARLVVAAKGGAVPVTSTGDSTTIQVGLTLEVRTILPMLYRKGKQTTGVTLSDLQAKVGADSVAVRMHLVRQGTAAFIGTVRGALVDSTGKVVSGFQAPQAVYYEMDPRFAASTAGLPPGRYRMRLEVTSEREDIAADLILPMVPVRDSVDLQLP